MHKTVLIVILLVITAFAGVEESFQRQQIQNFQRPDSGKVRIINPAGTTTVQPSEDGQVVIGYRLYAEASDFNTSRTLVSKFTSRIKEENGVLTADFGLPFESIDQLKFPFLDRKFEGELIWRERNIKVSRRKGTILEIVLQVEIPDDVELEIEGMIGKVSITGHRGDIAIDMSACETELFQTEAVHTIRTSVGALKSVKSSGSFAIDADQMDISGDFELIDTLRIAQKSGSARFDNIERITWLDLKMGDANLYMMVGDLGCGSITAADGNIDLKIYSRLNCEMAIETESG
ncbi:MAG: hypothetical protein ACP5G4_08955, partial [bacterium]